MWVALHIFEQFCAKARNANSLVFKPETDFFTQNGHSRSFKVIYFGVDEETLRVCIVQYNNCGVKCESSEDIVGKISENRHFRGPHSHLKPPWPANPYEYSHKLYFARNCDHWATFLSLTV